MACWIIKSAKFVFKIALSFLIAGRPAAALWLLLYFLNARRAYCRCVCLPCLFVYQKKTVVIYVYYFVLLIFIYYRFSDPLFFQFLDPFFICSHVFTCRGLLPRLSFLYAFLVSSTYFFAASSFSNQSVYISFLVVLANVLSGFSSASFVSTMFAVALPLLSKLLTTQNHFFILSPAGDCCPGSPFFMRIILPVFPACPVPWRGLFLCQSVRR